MKNPSMNLACKNGLIGLNNALNFTLDNMHTIFDIALNHLGLPTSTGSPHTESHRSPLNYTVLKKHNSQLRSQVHCIPDHWKHVYLCVLDHAQAGTKPQRVSDMWDLSNCNDKQLHLFDDNGQRVDVSFGKTTENIHTLKLFCRHIDATLALVKNYNITGTHSAHSNSIESLFETIKKTMHTQFHLEHKNLAIKTLFILVYTLYYQNTHTCLTAKAFLEFIPPQFIALSQQHLAYLVVMNQKTLPELMNSIPLGSTQTKELFTRAAQAGIELINKLTLKIRLGERDDLTSLASDNCFTLLGKKRIDPNLREAIDLTHKGLILSTFENSGFFNDQERLLSSIPVYSNEPQFLELIKQCFSLTELTRVDVPTQAALLALMQRIPMSPQASANTKEENQTTSNLHYADVQLHGLKNDKFNGAYAEINRLSKSGKKLVVTLCSGKYAGKKFKVLPTSSSLLALKKTEHLGPKHGFNDHEKVAINQIGNNIRSCKH